MIRLIGVITLFLGFQVQAQNQAVLEVQGNARISVKPTRTVVVLSIKSTTDTYAGTIEDLTSRVDLLVEVLKGINLEGSQIITSNFRVDKNFVYIQGERRAKGFNGLQTLEVSFKQDKRRLLQVLTTASSSKSRPEISVSFDLDTERKKKLEDQLIQMAVSDAKHKAQLIASESGYEVSGIKEISYGIQTYAPQAAVMRFDDAAESASFSNFEASDLKLTDSVLIRFYIRAKE